MDRPVPVYPVVPGVLQEPTEIPPVVETPVTIEAALDLGASLRVAACLLYAEYRELMRTASNGEIILAESTEAQCPKTAMSD